MNILGITGSVGMGKSTACRMLRVLGVPVHDADATVHALLGPAGAAVQAVAAAFSGVVRNGVIDRAALGACVFQDPEALSRLENIVHPLVRQSEQRFLKQYQRAGFPLVALDIPLLFETGGEDRCDYVAVVSAPFSIQKARVLSRKGMTEERLCAILARQMPDHEKRRRADWVVPTGLGRGVTFRSLRRIVRLLSSRSAS
ncbi:MULTISPECIES: dephospho-CoA kinase [unclassified Haematospirillum]|uniref:dephospho-CoA kinase n=1 Tax=unclassified Haematospirillum TaxID=2622088 RepID=UPI00143A7A88|nr:MULTISPECIES: dephospho-CoA kinase [unclassified Haematospirillum]NKD55552.1 dephospho-CoA kinase [Haematospirillum sp. H4890]NKD75691.1 dephospho-CoA kinase [Haematospirillum sp. H4485]NKD88317.1 dephospho-CoA kinase [Haematospirillum sp. 15-248]